MLVKPGRNRGGVTRSRTGVTRKSVDTANPVSTGMISDNHTLPLVIQPKVDGLELIHWTKRQQPWIEEQLLQHGALLFRGFHNNTAQVFSNYVDALPFKSLVYRERSTPRSAVQGNVYTSTAYPPEETIALHHELSTAQCFPRKVLFYCAVQPGGGGQTPIGDGYRIYERIDPKIRDIFKARGWLLVRNYGGGVGLDWREAFHTQDRADVENYCRENLIEWQWLNQDHLRTRQRRPAILLHPVTQRPVWFNHMAFWHPANLADVVREEMFRAFGDDGLPYHTYYGDGATIPDDVANHIRDCYEAEKQCFDWREGDLMLVDNARVTHGRMPFTGERSILVAMVQGFTRVDLPFQPALA